MGFLQAGKQLTTMGLEINGRFCKETEEYPEDLPTNCDALVKSCKSLSASHPPTEHLRLLEPSQTHAFLYLGDLSGWSAVSAIDEAVVAEYFGQSS